MPFFYSQYLKEDKTAKAAKTSRGKGARSSALVWHSGTGASGKARRGAPNYKPLGYKPDGKRKKNVHFSTIEVQPFHFDWDLADKVFYTRAELTVMGQSRFDDAAKLRQKRNLDSVGHAKDDVGISKKSNEEDLAELLELALGDGDPDEDVSIRGIEHFVYPALQQEMIRRKKEVQKEVLEFVRSKRPNPQGWKLAEHSRKYSLWARNVALEKGMKYVMSNAAADPEVGISEEERQQFQKSQDSIDDSSRSIRGSLSFPGRGSASFEEESMSKLALHDISEVAKHGGDQDRSYETQPAGVDTGED